MRPVIESVAEAGETNLHGMGGGEWWERAQVFMQRGKELAAEAWKAAKENWREFIRHEGSGRGPTLER
jgi:hypothetical protein